jgi:hypothetical protein
MESNAPVIHSTSLRWAILSLFIEKYRCFLAYTTWKLTEIRRACSSERGCRISFQPNSKASTTLEFETVPYPAMSRALKRNGPFEDQVAASTVWSTDEISPLLLGSIANKFAGEGRVRPTLRDERNQTGGAETFITAGGCPRHSIPKLVKGAIHRH